ncbi:metallophosphoesterase [Corynebacterium lizhenjunii]|uniref:Nuclease SbcCD subunit D n=1 Tax=Corynebacterium lizhenjunii TaxID=2709394 RepID=A0A7T0KIF1_9CORY|nr:metallophosphoesterase [Corynebacterium lizhenjunii]QPK80298.1 metallophosphoesterase [Corynebacterium lizhenjunii]
MSGHRDKLENIARSVTFIHTSDFQLGMQRWFLEGEAQARFNNARLAAIDRLGGLAKDTGAQFIVVAGDVFDANSLSNTTTKRAMERLRRLPVPVYLLPGNHDPLVADSILNKMEGENIHVISDCDPVVALPGVEVVGAPLMTKHATRDLVAQMLEPLEPTQNIRVAVGHGQVFSRAGDSAPDQIDLPTVEEALANRVFDYLALGDTHSTQSLSDTGAVWFSGAPETTDFHGVDAGGGGNGEVDSGNALVVTISKDAGGVSVDVSKHAIGTWTFHAVDAQLNSMADVEAFLQRLADYPNKDETVIKYGLTGTLSLQAQAALEQGLAEFGSIFAALYPRDRRMDLVLEPAEGELEELNLQGYAAGVLEELVDRLGQDPVARDAANLLFRLAGGQAALVSGVKEGK